jgi:hypothetical protein
VPYEDTASAKPGYQTLRPPEGLKGVCGINIRRLSQSGGFEFHGITNPNPFPKAHLAARTLKSSNSCWTEPRPFVKQRNGSSFREELEMRSLDVDRMPEDPFVRAAMC